MNSAKFAMFLALPFLDITYCALRSEIFPDAYKISEIVAIPKENPPRAKGLLHNKCLAKNRRYQRKCIKPQYKNRGETKVCKVKQQ